jgi:hypothetical protein
MTKKMILQETILKKNNFIQVSQGHGEKKISKENYQRFIFKYEKHIPGD